MTIPPITPPTGPAPNRITDTPTEFSEKADEFASWWEILGNEINPTVDAMNITASQVDANAVVASDAATSATISEGVCATYAAEKNGVPLGDGQWGAGKEYTSYSQYLVFNGVYYKSLTIPYTTQGTDPTLPPDNVNVQPWSPLTELQSIARSLNVDDAEVIYDTDTVTPIPGYIHSQAQQRVYITPSEARGKTIQSLAGNVLTTSDLSVYTLPAMSQPVEVFAEWFGAVGDAVTINTDAINEAYAYAAANNIAKVRFGRGVFAYSGSLDIPKGVSTEGAGAPKLAPTPLFSDDKEFLRPGYKHLLPGTTLLFVGTQTKTLTTSRTDRFSSYGYAVKSPSRYGVDIKGVGIVMDMDVYDASGSLTTPLTDNRSNYDVALVIDDSADNKIEDVNTFGYWNKSGLVVVSQSVGANPDYNFFHMCEFMGDIGASLIGSSVVDVNAEGLTGTTFSQCKLFDKLHHDRSTTNVADLGTNIVYIDGITGVGNGIAGHNFIGCELRSLVEVPISLDQCRATSFISCTTEMVDSALYPGAVKYIEGTASTGSIAISGGRWLSAFNQWRRLSNQISGDFILDNDDEGTNYRTKSGKGVKIGAPDLFLNDPAKQLSDDFSSFSNGWVERYNVRSDRSTTFSYNGTVSLKLSVDGDVEAPNGRFKGFVSGGARQSQTILAGEITILDGTSYVAIATEAGAPTDNLTTINGGGEGDILILTSFSASNSVVVTPSTNIRLSTAGAFTINAVDCITLMKHALGFWIEVSRSDNVL